MFVPAGTPPPVIARLSAACAAALRAPEVVGRLAAPTAPPTRQPREAWAPYSAAGSGWRSKLVRARDIRVQ